MIKKHSKIMSKTGSKTMENVFFFKPPDPPGRGSRLDGSLDEQNNPLQKQNKTMFKIESQSDPKSI